MWTENGKHNEYHRNAAPPSPGSGTWGRDTGGGGDAGHRLLAGDRLRARL